MARGPIIVNKGRLTEVIVSLGYNISSESFSSQIRAKEKRDSDLIATWDVSFLTDGADGDLLLSLDDSDNNITRVKGYMDVKKITGGKPMNVWETPIEVLFQEPVTE